MGTENLILRMACKEWSLLREIKGMGRPKGICHVGLFNPP